MKPRVRISAREMVECRYLYKFTPPDVVHTILEGETERLAACDYVPERGSISGIYMYKYILPTVVGYSGETSIEVRTPDDAMSAWMPSLAVVVGDLADVAMIVLVTDANVCALIVGEAVGSQRGAGKHCLHL